MFWGTRVPAAVAHDLLDRAVDRGARFVDTANCAVCAPTTSTSPTPTSTTRVPLSETLGALQEVVERGWARAIAASNLTADRLIEALRAAAEGPRYVALQNRITLLPPDPDADFGRQVVLDEAVQATCQANHVAMVGYSTLLEGAHTRADRPLPQAYQRPGSDGALRALATVADEIGLGAGQAVLAWLTHRPARIVPVAGVSRPDQLDSAVTTVTTPISPAAVDTLDEVRQQAA